MSGSILFFDKKDICSVVVYSHTIKHIEAGSITYRGSQNVARVLGRLCWAFVSCWWISFQKNHALCHFASMGFSETEIVFRLGGWNCSLFTCMYKMPETFVFCLVRSCDLWKCSLPTDCVTCVSVTCLRQLYSCVL